MNRFRSLLAATLAAGLLAALPAARAQIRTHAPDPATGAGAAVSVEDAWVRATVPGQSATGAFLRITSPVPAKLVGVSSAIAASTDLHESVEEGGMKKMRPVAALDLPAGKTVSLAPGGWHVMFTGLKAPVTEGATVPLTLVIDDGKTRRNIEVNAQVRALTTPADGGHMQHQH
ncbi:copper chaperone PCu(A)C [Derxia gummosa]|uniref:Copper chaperone PCu(A)C n=1 Tax=Derxia gummosa DSM 723 TaxID=1121388 RepID=A0A8B6XA93_9BURK|nr:copper chaperone PCu(A)C [Derxia gummosa]